MVLALYVAYVVCVCVCVCVCMCVCVCVCVLCVCVFVLCSSTWSGVCDPERVGKRHATSLLFTLCLNRLHWTCSLQNYTIHSDILTYTNAHMCHTVL